MNLYCEWCITLLTFSGTTLHINFLNACRNSNNRIRPMPSASLCPSYEISLNEGTRGWNHLLPVRWWFSENARNSAHKELTTRPACLLQSEAMGVLPGQTEMTIGRISWKTFQNCFVFLALFFPSFCKTPTLGLFILGELEKGNPIPWDNLGWPG